jgi:hypothetical protein
MGHSHKTRSQDQRGQHAITSLWPHGRAHVTRSPKKRGCALYLFNFGFSTLGYDFYLAIFNGFFPLLGDRESDLRPDLERKMGV